MSINFQTLWILFILLIFNTSVTTQTTTLMSQKVEIIEPLDLNNYKDWKKVYFSEFSMYAPQHFKIDYIPTIDATFYGYKDKDFIITIQLSRFSPRVTVPKNSRDFKERVLVIDDDWAFLSTYEKDYGGLDYVNEIYFYFKNSKQFNYASVFLRSKDKQKGRELAEKMFYSIKYEEEPKKEKPKIEAPQKEVKREKGVKKTCGRL